MSVWGRINIIWCRPWLENCCRNLDWRHVYVFFSSDGLDSNRKRSDHSEVGGFTFVKQTENGFIAGHLGFISGWQSRRVSFLRQLMVYSSFRRSITQYRGRCLPCRIESFHSYTFPTLIRPKHMNKRLHGYADVMKRRHNMLPKFEGLCSERIVKRRFHIFVGERWESRSERGVLSQGLSASFVHNFPIVVPLTNSSADYWLLPSLIVDNINLVLYPTSPSWAKGTCVEYSFGSWDKAAAFRLRHHASLEL